MGEIQYTAPVLQDTVYIIMWQSKRSGGTYTELRKSEQGKDRFLHALEWMGVDMSTVLVTRQSKPWVPVRKTRRKS